jgi:hypothetical protein
MKAQGQAEFYVFVFLNSALDKVNGLLQVPAALPQGKDRLFPIA